MRLRLVKEAFDDPDYVFELKHDGFRGVVYLQNGECKIISRNQRLLRFDSLAKALAGLPVRNAIIDGEVVCLDQRGVSQFNQLLFRRGNAVLYAFDLLWHNDEDLRQLPLIQRKQRLHQLVRKSHCPQILYAQHLEYAGKWLFSETCDQDLEGIVCKRRDGIYGDARVGQVQPKDILPDRGEFVRFCERLFRPIQDKFCAAFDAVKASRSATQVH